MSLPALGICAAPCAPPQPSRLSLQPSLEVSETSVHKSHIINAVVLPDSHGTGLQRSTVPAAPALHLAGVLVSPDGPGKPWSHLTAPIHAKKTIGRLSKSFPGHAQEHQALCRCPRLRGHFVFSQKSMTPTGRDCSQVFYT